MIKKLLIANRGEIVCRIDRTCRRLGIRTATVHSVADRNSVHVRTVGESIEIGPAPSAQSYLNIEAVLAAARRVAADAIHPGIGFLSEDPAFAEAVSAAGLLFIGPSPDLLRRFGDKWAAKHEARLARIPVIGGSEGSSSDAIEVERIIREELRLPVVLKAAAGGGGKGVRIVRDLNGLSSSIQAAMREARASFGRAELIVEEFIESARHVEVQIAGDGNGDAIHLFERECSLQRRFQKIVEEAPAIGLSDDLRRSIIEDAVNLARSVKYKNLGTVEFLVSNGSHYFLECNPRLQVEHTVTEEITSLDLVELQLQIAMNDALPISQDQVAAHGHAIQMRVYAEDATAGFAPSTGRLDLVSFPDDARVETSVEAGSEITPYYDPMIAKLILHDASREGALERCIAALERTVVVGVKTNVPFLRQLLVHPLVRSGAADNRFIDRELDALCSQLAPGCEEAAVAAAVVWASQSRDQTLGLWSGDGNLSFWSYDAGGLPAGPPAFSLRGSDGRLWPVMFGPTGADGSLRLLVDAESFVISIKERDPNQYEVAVAQKVITIAAIVAADTVTIQGPFGTFELAIVPFLSLAVASSSLGGMLAAPMMGTILKVHTRVGDRVRKSDVLVIEESMKMEMSLVAPMDAVVTAVRCREGDVVERNQCLIELEAVIGDGQ